MDDPPDLHELSRRLARGIDFLDRPMVLRKYEVIDLIVSIRPNIGGMAMSQPYHGQAYDPEHYRVVKGGWDHEHCFLCKKHVLSGDEWWTEAEREDIGLCPDCHDFLSRSSEGMLAIGLRNPRDEIRLSRQTLVVMTEAEWLASTVPRAMVMTMEERKQTGEFERKFRLFACACVRRAWHLLSDERSRNAVDVAERYADGLATPEELEAAGHEATYAASELYVSGGLQAADNARIEGLKEARSPDGAVSDEKPGNRAWNAANAAGSLCRRKVGTAPPPGWYEGGGWIAVTSVPRSIFEALADAAILRVREAEYQATASAISEPLSATNPIDGALEITTREATHHATVEAHRFYEEPWQADLLRCLFGNPHRPSSFDPSWLTVPVISLAQSMYDERAFDRMPALADALEIAGCADLAILAHCRGSIEHARGCWVIDGLLGKL